jgi:hypothetical protein
MMIRDEYQSPSEALKMALGVGVEDGVRTLKGTYIIHLVDSDTGEVLHHSEHSNIVTLDGGVLVMINLASGGTPVPPSQRGITMLAVGTGATGPVLNPDAPDPRQRHLNAEIARKPFTSTVFRNAVGAAVSVPTNVCDFTVTFGVGEAVGALNEMGLIRSISLNPLTLNPVPSVFPAYDPTVDLTLYDILANYTTMGQGTGPIGKPNNSVLTLTWRLSS